MQHIYRILDKLLILFKQSNKSKESDSRKPLGKVSFILNEDNNISIECVLPNITNVNINEVSNLAENYANLLSSITFGELNDALYENIKNISNSNNDNQVLFVNNVLSFWSIFYKQKQQGNVAKIKNKYLPLIRPSQAFKIS